MKRPRFTIVVPTRNRPGTIPFTLKTCLAQEFENYEIIVFDNASNQPVTPIAQSLKSDRIRCIRSETPLAMSDSWEAAAKHATGEFITYVGDDDGLLPGALRHINEMIEVTGCKLLRWSCVSYRWPDYPFEGRRNTIKIPLGNTSYLIKGRRIIKDVARFRYPFHALPSIYWGMAHRTVLDKLRATGGRVFRSCAPDIGSGFALASQVESFVSLDSPMGVVGHSASSNGTLQLVLGHLNSTKTLAAQDFTMLNRQAGIMPPSSLPDVNCTALVVAESFMRAKECWFPADSYLKLDELECLNDIAKQLEATPKAQAQIMAGKIIEHYRRMPAKLAHFKKLLDAIVWDERKEVTKRESPMGFSSEGSTLGLYGPDFGVSDVFGASQLAGKILNYDRGGLKAEIRPFEINLGHRIRQAAKTILREKTALLADM